MQSLTHVERRTVDAIRTMTTEANGVPPTYQELANRMGMGSKSTAFRHVQTLVDKGYVVVAEHGSRSIRIAEPPQRMVAALADEIWDIVSRGSSGSSPAYGDIVKAIRDAWARCL